MTINVALGGTLPKLLRDIIRTLASNEPDIAVSSITPGALELNSQVREQETDVVIVGYDASSGDSVGMDLLNRCNRTMVIAVANGDCSAVLFRLMPTSKYLGQLSPESLLAAIRESQYDIPSGDKTTATLADKKWPT